MSIILDSLILLSLFFSIQSYSQNQQITYVIDDSFDTNETLRARAGITDIIELEDGSIFLKGSKVQLYEGNGPFNNGAGMIQANGSPHPDYINDHVSAYGTELYLHGDHYFYTGYPTLGRITTLGESYYSIHGDVWGDYFKIGEWGAGYENPYNKRYVEDVFITEDDKVIIAGAIATDTLQPQVYRHLMRLNQDGSHDSTFPIIEAEPQSPFTKITHIKRSSNGSWFVTGNFSGINGHPTANLAKFHPDFSIDTSFTSPLAFSPYAYYFTLTFIDIHDRLWITGLDVRLAQQPDFTHGVVRILQNGMVDSSFTTTSIQSIYPGSWTQSSSRIMGVKGMSTDEDIFILYGSFNFYNDTLSKSIVAINDQGYIQNNFFNGNGAQFNIPDEDDPQDIYVPFVSEVKELTDGTLMVGGSFSSFFDDLNYNLVKLIPSTLTSTQTIAKEHPLKVYPNPSNGILIIDHRVTEGASLKIYSLNGINIENMTINTNHIDLSSLIQGVYFLEMIDSSGNRFITKWVKQ